MQLELDPREVPSHLAEFFEPVPGLKPKDLTGIPWRVALALQEDGWYLRSDIIWHKPNCMPESVTDRPTRAHEYLFLLSKRSNYFYDCNAVREQAAYGYSQKPAMFDRIGNAVSQPERTAGRAIGGRDGTGGTRNLRTVWTIPSSPFKDAHFATFPTKLVEPCILAGTSEQGHCQHPGCGARWVRVVEREFIPVQKSTKGGKKGLYRVDGSNAWEGISPGVVRTETTGWLPTCDHGLEPVPDVVLDPFLGSGTVARVAQDLGRGWIGVDLNPAYEPMQKHRTAQMALVLGPSTAQIAVF